MQSIAELLQNKIEKPKYRSERHELLEELITMYLGENKVENYCRFIYWIKSNKKPNNKESVIEFKKAKLPKNEIYIKPISKSFFAIKLSHIKTKDLYYIKSMKNDFKNRNGYKRSQFTKWLFSAIKIK